MAFIQDPPDLWENAGMLGSVCVSCVAFISQLLDLLGPPCSHQPTEEVLVSCPGGYFFIYLQPLEAHSVFLSKETQTPFLSR